MLETYTVLEYLKTRNTIFIVDAILFQLETYNLTSKQYTEVEGFEQMPPRFFGLFKELWNKIAIYKISRTPRY